MGRKPSWRALSNNLLGGLPEGESLCLSEDVRKQYVVVPAQRVEGLGKGDKITRDQSCALMDELIKGVLAVGSRFTPVDGAGLVIDLGAVEDNVLAIALHCQLLQVRRETLEVLLIRKNR